MTTQSCVLSMLFIILFGAFIFVARSIVVQLPSVAKALEEHAKYPGAARTVSTRFRCEQMAAATGTVWQDWSPESQSLGLETDGIEESGLDGSSMRRAGIRQQFFGPMNMNVGADKIQIFDCLLDVATGKYTQSYFQTVIAIKPDQLDLPAFCMRPKKFMVNERLALAPPVTTDTPLDFVFDIDTMLQHRVKALFHSKLGAEVLVPFLVDQQWTVEWTGNRLIVYTLDRLIPPTQLADFALEVSEFFELLKNGPAAIDEQMQQLIATAQ